MGETRARSTRARRAPSHRNTRAAIRASVSNSGPRRLPGLRDAATGFRVIDPVVIHPGEGPYEFVAHLIELLQRQGGLVELPRREAAFDDLLDRRLELRGGDRLEHRERPLPPVRP